MTCSLSEFGSIFMQRSLQTPFLFGEIRKKTNVTIATTAIIMRFMNVARWIYLKCGSSLWRGVVSGERKAEWLSLAFLDVISTEVKLI